MPQPVRVHVLEYQQPLANFLHELQYWVAPLPLGRAVVQFTLLSMLSAQSHRNVPRDKIRAGAERYRMRARCPPPARPLQYTPPAGSDYAVCWVTLEFLAYLMLAYYIDITAPALHVVQERPDLVFI
jgi:hypothetical protein